MALYWQGSMRKLGQPVAEVAAPRPRANGLEVDWLVNEHCDTLVIEGHVDLTVAADAIRREGGSPFPAPRHTWMRYMAVPEGELNESDERNGWRGECPKEARGAEPVTISVRTT